METLDLIQAAEFLKMKPAGLRRKVYAGLIPGAKPGKHWVFLKDDLVSYLRSQYDTGVKVPQGDMTRSKKCRSTTKIKAGYGGLTSRTRDSEYDNLLGLPTR